MSKRDFYDILGVSKGASEDEIKKSYKRLAKLHHPDVDKSPTAEERFKEINEAYQILSDKEKRSAYDRLGHAAFDQTMHSGFSGDKRGGSWGPFSYTYTSTGSPFGEGNFSDPFDIFEQVFGFRDFTRQSRRGRDLHYVITVNFVDTVKGLTQKISLDGKNLTVKIPAGIQDGAQLRFAGEGDSGPNNTPKGDLYLTVRVNPHPNFMRSGDDIHLVEDLKLSQAVLGDTIEVPVVDPSASNGQSSVKLKIPTGTQPGTEFRLGGKGMPRLYGRGRGDTYVHVRIKLPENVSREARSAFERLRDLGM